MHSLEKTIDKRQVFVTMGCAKFPYERIKELAGTRQGLSFGDLSTVPIADDEKVTAIEQLDFFSEPIMRLLALRYAKSTFNDLQAKLSGPVKELAGAALPVIQGFLLGEETHAAVCEVNERVTGYLNRELYTKPYEEVKEQVACLEILLSVTKWKARGAMYEASSIQRDVLGPEIAARQLQDMERIARHLNDL